AVDSKRGRLTQSNFSISPAGRLLLGLGNYLQVFLARRTYARHSELRRLSVRPHIAGWRCRFVFV
ncbi:MAG: hypothetical protein DMF14_07250, partial [Verrucomicrobia bacterium]